MARQWAEPQPDWVPLRRAVLTFYGEESPPENVRNKLIEKRARDHGLKLTRSHDKAFDRLAAALEKLQRRKNFDRAVSKGRGVLYARPETLSKPFEKLGADVWPLLKVSDWEKGIAITRDGVRFWSIHVKFTAATLSPNSLRKATSELIHLEIDAVVAEAKLSGRKPPNLVELRPEVRRRLAAKGYRATVRQIEELAKHSRHEGQRRPIGKTLRRV